MFNIVFIIYVMIAVAVCFGGAFKLYQMGLTFGTLVFIIGSVFVFLLFGVRWFGTTGSIFSKTPVSWPPVINTCPDYLTYYKKPDGTEACIDTIGVSRNGELKKWPTDGSVPPAASESEYYFYLATTSTDKQKSEWCKRALDKGLSWEGITNGESCAVESS